VILYLLMSVVLHLLMSVVQDKDGFCLSRQTFILNVRFVTHPFFFQNFKNVFIFLLFQNWNVTTNAHSLFSQSLAKIHIGLVQYVGASREYLTGKYDCTVDLLFDWFGISCMTTDNFLFLISKQTNPNQ